MTLIVCVSWWTDSQWKHAKKVIWEKNYQKNIPSTNMSQLSKLTTVYDIIIIRSFEGLELNNLKQNKKQH